MSADGSLISTLVVGFVLAFIFGTLAHRLKFPPLVGYILAGIIVGPHTPGFVANQELGTQLANIGIVLLMFGVGLQFSPRDLMSVRAFAVRGTVLQIALATPLGLMLGLALGWPFAGALLFGFSLTITSTVVLLKALQDRRLIETERGRLTIGWAVAEDFATVLALVLIPAFVSVSAGVTETAASPLLIRLFGQDFGLAGAITFTLAQIAAFGVTMLIIGKRAIPSALQWVAQLGSRELFRLAVLAIALGAALGSAELFGVSLAIGAFFAGMILAESELSQRAAQETIPLRDAFAVLFFVSVGMLFDPAILIQNPLAVLAVVLIVIVARAAITTAIALFYKHSLSTGLLLAAARSPIGEFSFILGALGLTLGILPQKALDLIVAGALISITLNSAVFWATGPIEARLKSWFRRPAAAKGESKEASTTTVPEPVIAPASPEPATAPALEVASPSEEEDNELLPTSKTGHDIVVGYGVVGATILKALTEDAREFLLIEDNSARVADAKTAGIETIPGNAVREDTLKLANIAEAERLFVAVPETFESGAIIGAARKLNPGLLIITRAHTDTDKQHLLERGASAVVVGAVEIARTMVSHLTEDVSSADGVIEMPDTPETEDELDPLSSSESERLA